MITYYDIEEVNETWEKLTSKIEELYECLDDFQDKLDHIEPDYVGDKQSKEVDGAWGLIKQCQFTIERLEEIKKTYERRFEVTFEKIKDVETVCEPYEQFIKRILEKRKKGF